MWNRRLALITDTGPCTSMPDPNDQHVEPCLVLLAHQRDDRWLQTHEMTYMIYKRNQSVETVDGVRVQVPRQRNGKFLNQEQRTEHYTNILQGQVKK